MVGFWPLPNAAEDQHHFLIRLQACYFTGDDEWGALVNLKKLIYDRDTEAVEPHGAVSKGGWVVDSLFKIYIVKIQFSAQQPPAPGSGTSQRVTY